ncbi:short-chain dehydrogenase [Penicillium alfredii]|uniref:Short-chain dehydrogenase n=1 Tax=Penicillium alfredii TaxID=1506179 RepID=A0A9W9JYP6_9EURO|nr:short-chain dehydrogenase [Penicillium alfredii]KAJ5086518.1 short-chain dehydrogenase [Penicillium alfredii]
MASNSAIPVWFITTASSGFGHEIASAALQRGHRVIATPRDLTKQATETYGRIDYLINTAAYILEGTVEEATTEEVQQKFNVNVFGTVNTIRAFLPYLRAQPVTETRPRATIATFGSLGSWQGGASYAFYGMTKACMSSLAESLGAELAPFDIRVTVVEPNISGRGVLKAGAKVSTQARIPAYENQSTPSGMLRSFLLTADGTQPGDVRKGVAVLLDILTASGVAEGKELPARIVLGSDCEAVVRDKCQGTLDFLDTWGPISRLTDYAKEA